MSHSPRGTEPVAWDRCTDGRFLAKICTSGGEERARGHTFFVDVIGDRRADIIVSRTRRLRLKEWQFRKGAMLVGLLRSPAQSYVQLFGCLCYDEGHRPEKRCFMENPSTQGVTGQGYSWQVLVARIIFEVRSWDYRLASFANHRADGNRFQVSAWERGYRHSETPRANEEEGKILLEERVSGREGKFRLQLGAETKVVRRQRKVRLRREAQVMTGETVGFWMRGERQRFVPDPYGFQYT